MKSYDDIVIGSGAGAIISDEAAAQGLKVALIDKGPLIGGTCLNWGCIPSKMLIYTADRIVEIEEARKLGIEAEISNIDFKSIMERMRHNIRENQAHIREGIKQAEGLARTGQPIRPVSVMAEVARVTHTQAYQRADTNLAADLADCEDFGSIIITFEDGSVAEVCSSDLVLGGVYNYVEVFLSNGRIRCNMNPNNMVQAYGPTDDSFGDEYLAEKISTREGWNFASPLRLIADE